MKHGLLSFFTAAMLIFVTLPCKAYNFSAVTPSGHTLYYNIVNGEAQVTPRSTYGYYLEVYCSSLAGDLIIPDTVTYNGSSYCVTSIGDNAFGCSSYGEGCTLLTSITIPNSVTTIGESAFYKCTSLTSITIPNSVTSIGNSAFYECTSLTSVTIPNSVTTIGENAFQSCTSLTSVTIPNSVTTIEGSAFHNCISLTSITIPNSVTTIGEVAFGNCTLLSSVTIPNSVTTIGNWAFDWCTSLTSITIPDSVTYIGEGAFSGCTSLTSINIPNSITSIENNTFSGCTSLTSISIPDSVTYIGEGAFSGCTSLTSINIPNSITSIENSTFSGCTSLTSITIPNTVTTIGEGAFWGCTSLTSISIPDSVTHIGGSAFSGCTSLTSITIPDSVTTIEGGTFYNCTSLTSITIPNSVTTIEGDVHSVGGGVFSGCISLTSITIPNSVTHIGGGAFSGCTSLSSINISNSVTSIEDETFYNCTSLTSINIPNSVTTIGDGAFGGCTSLTSISIPDSVTHIGGGAFSGCTSLTIITIPNSITRIESNTFSGCTSLTSVTIPNSVTTIGGGAFSMCVIDTLNMGHSVPFALSWGNYALSQANIINIPCGATANYLNIWGAGNYYEPNADVELTLSALTDDGGIAIIIPQNGSDISCSDSTAVIQATANYGYHFVQWNNGSIANPDTLHLVGDSTVTAIFAKNQYTLTITSNDDSIGTVSGGGTYEYLDEATLIATATAAHHHFVQWNDGETDTLRTITVTQDLSLTAIFAIDTHQVATATNNELYGSVDGAGFFPYGSTVTLTPNPENGYYFVYWNNSDTANPNTFTVTGDTLLSALFAPEIVPSICMVSVENDHNVLLWEKDYPVSFYNIYCEGNTSNEYELIATIPYTALSTYADTASRPRTRSYRYRLSATDIYGHEADLSDIHKTMHLTISQGVGNQWNLVWTEYEGADYTTYVIYRGTDATNIQQIDVMPSGGNFTYTDVNAPAGDVYYQVGIMLSSPCNPTKSNYLVLSNIATNSTVGIQSHTDEAKVYAYNGHIMVSSESAIQDIRIYDITGKLLKTVAVNGNDAVVNISDCASGVYMVQVHTANGYDTRKVVR